MKTKVKQWMTVNITAERWEKLDSVSKQYEMKKTDLINDFIDHIEIWLDLMVMAKNDTRVNLKRQVEKALQEWEGTPEQPPEPDMSLLTSKKLPWENPPA